MADMAAINKTRSHFLGKQFYESMQLGSLSRVSHKCAGMVSYKRRQVGLNIFHIHSLKGSQLSQDQYETGCREEVGNHKYELRTGCRHCVHPKSSFFGICLLCIRHSGNQNLKEPAN